MSNKRRMTSRDLLRFQMCDDPQVSPDGTQVAWVKTWLDAEHNGYRSQILITEIAGGASRELTTGAALETFPRWSPDGSWIAYLAPSAGSEAAPANSRPPVAAAVTVTTGSPQLWIIPAAGGTPRQLTGLSGGVRSISWSPDGTRLLATSFVDPARGLETHTPVPSAEDLYAHFNRDVLVVDRLRWKSDSMGFLGNYRQHVILVPFDPTGNSVEVTLLSNGPFDLEAPAWSPDGKQIAAVGNLDPGGEAARKSYIYLLDATASAPVEPRKLFGLEEIRSSDMAWSPDGSKIAVCGHDDPVLGHYGNQKLWLVATADGHAECVSEHIDYVFGDYSRNHDMRRYGGDDGPRWLPDGSGLLVLLNKAGTVNLCRFDLAGRELSEITSGDHSVVAFSTSSDARTIVTLIGHHLNPADLFLVEDAAQSPAGLRRLSAVNQALFEEVLLSPAERFSCLSGDVTIEGWVIPPVERQPGRRYPVILYTGGGPGGMRASVFCQEFQLYANQGYAVINCNTRGNHGYGEAFSVATRGAWGDLDYQDNIAFLRAVCASFDYVDPERLAVAGGSYGGYSAAWIIARHPEFKAAVVDRSLVNRTSQVGTSDIGYLLDQVEFNRKPPWETLDTLIQRSPISYVGSVKTPTLVVHSALDHRCAVEQGEQYFMALKRLGVPTELVRFPNETHELSRSGRPWHRIFRLDRYLDWFARWL